MKKKLEAELISIAHKVLKLKDTSSIPQLQEQTRLLYEKLSILHFAETHFSEAQPTIGTVKSILEEMKMEIAQSTETAAIAQQRDNKETEETAATASTIETTTTIKEEVIAPTPKKPEIIIEKINEKVSEDLFVPVPKFTEENISLSEPSPERNSKESPSIAQTSPIVETNSDEDEKPKSLNDQLKKGINIGLNDRLAFIKHLFDGSSTDYNRVLSQLNTLNSKSGAKQFILNMVKPDYNNWVDKEEYEERFIEIVTNKYKF